MILSVWRKKNVYLKNLKINQGFTLLEIMVAIAIVGITLGTLFNLLTGSKRLAFQASHDISEVVLLRSAVSAAYLFKEPKIPELPSDLAGQLSFKTDDLLESPERQTQKIQLALEPYTITDDKSGMVLSSLRWKKLTASQAQ